MKNCGKSGKVRKINHDFSRLFRFATKKAPTFPPIIHQSLWKKVFLEKYSFSALFAKFYVTKRFFRLFTTFFFLLTFFKFYIRNKSEHRLIYWYFLPLGATLGVFWRDAGED